MSRSERVVAACGRALGLRFAMCLVAVCLVAPASLVAQDGGAGIVALSAADVAELESDRRLGFPAISLEELGRLGVTDVQTGVGMVSGMFRGSRLELYLGAPFVRYGRAVYQLPNAPYEAAGRYWIPASLVEGWIARASGPVGAPSSDSASPEVAMALESSGAAPVSAPPVAPARPLRVMLDPGHGGRDPGTTGRRGTREKNVVLAIAKLVHAELSDVAGIEPMLTRDRDVLIPLEKRSQLAVAQEADLFVSIHANASRSRSAQGFETYFLGEARTDESREVAMRENSAVQYEDGGAGPRAEEVQFILAQLNLASFQRESSRIGGYVQNSLRDELRTPDRGVKQNVFWVLVGSTGSMPSILVEIGFLSNEQEEKFLSSKAGQQRVARAIVRAVKAYRDDYAPRLQAAGAR